MGVMIEGKWHAVEPAGDVGDAGDDGKFRRSLSTFRDWITPDGKSGFAAEAGAITFMSRWAARGRTAP